jgi:peptidoglycan hydrolase-like protein with peptidoglycan-binding domain
MSEWVFAGEIARGSSGTPAKRVQEWLCLHDVYVVIDGRYGPATAEAVRQFQALRGLPQTEVVDRVTFERLLQPLTTALSTLEVDGRSLGALIVAYAEQHLMQRPREIGGQNMGPWVRLYMKGKQGTERPWCAGFACFVVGQASSTMSVPTPIRMCVSCDLLAADAKKRAVFLPEAKVGSPTDVPPGSLFLSRRTPHDWVHTGLVVDTRNETFDSIEGNTNDAGDREGYEVCRRVRGYQNKDFILMN